MKTIMGRVEVRKEGTDVLFLPPAPERDPTRAGLRQLAIARALYVAGLAILGLMILAGAEEQILALPMALGFGALLAVTPPLVTVIDPPFRSRLVRVIEGSIRVTPPPTTADYRAGVEPATVVADGLPITRPREVVVGWTRGADRYGIYLVGAHAVAKLVEVRRQDAAEELAAHLAERVRVPWRASPIGELTVTPKTSEAVNAVLHLPARAAGLVGGALGFFAGTIPGVLCVLAVPTLVELYLDGRLLEAVRAEADQLACATFGLELEPLETPDA